MSEGERVTVTEQDRERAAATVRALSPEQYVDEFVYDGDVQPLIEAVAAALAEERERTRAPFEQAADEMHEFADRQWPSTEAAIGYFEDRIRCLVKEMGE